MMDDGEFRFPPNLNPESLNELKYITLWELWAQPAIPEIFSDANHLARPDHEACAERVIRELVEEGYATLTGGRGDESTHVDSAELDDILGRVRDWDGWKADGRHLVLTPTSKWDAWASINKYRPNESAGA